MTDERVGVRIRVRGTVQGVGFRPWVHRVATELGISGRVSNDGAGVTIEAFGRPEALARLRAALDTSAPPAARIQHVHVSAVPVDGTVGFTIVVSSHGEDRRVSIPADLATCADCLRDVDDPANRRFRYAFTNCTNCGPRFTVARDVPYDRATTTMAAFAMCEACAREYGDPADRRFHAEPIACPHCGPRLQLVDRDGTTIEAADAIAHAARAIAAGRVVALKGLGGFHLACDATRPEPVAGLRSRKHRDEKPFAVMVTDLAAAERVAILTDAERALLRSVESPIVLVRRADGASIDPSVAPGSPIVGLLLPYTPLHHLLARAVGTPMVLTSGNLSEEPLAYRNDEAIERLRGIADLFVVHDRDIATPCDDSVVRVVGGSALPMRRSRGYVPRSVRLAKPLARPVLGCGALLKNTCCLASADEAWLGPHVGDLDGLATARFFEASIERLERFLRIAPEVVAHDLHPGYVSTAYARARAGADAVAVQHHHAHVASLMAERGLEGPVLGIAFDGTGYGTDGDAWGGEFLLARYDGFERLATFRPMPLAGGDAAIRQVWRLALAVLLDAYDGDPPLDAVPVLAGIRPADVTVVRQLLASGVHAPRAHGVGRYFDAFGALVLGACESRYEGQVAVALNHAAEGDGGRGYPFEVDTSTTPWEIDLRPATRATVGDLAGPGRQGLIAARFHATLVEATATVAAGLCARVGRMPVALTGGCFQNPLLAEPLVRALRDRGLVAHTHAQVPAGDGGVALGQVVVAAAVADRVGS